MRYEPLVCLNHVIGHILRGHEAFGPHGQGALTIPQAARTVRRHGRFYDGPYVAAYGNGGGKPTVAELQQAMGITWTDVREELTEAIPPAYTAWIGRAYLATLAPALGVAA